MKVKWWVNGEARMCVSSCGVSVKVSSGKISCCLELPSPSEPRHRCHRQRHLKCAAKISLQSLTRINQFLRVRQTPIPGLYSAVASATVAANSNTEEQLLQTGRIARGPTSNCPQGGTVAADQTPLSSGGGHQGDWVHFRCAPGPECVDPCSLSQSELETAIADLLSTVAFETNAIHPDRLNILSIY
jgi:hypothetical protein